MVFKRQNTKSQPETNPMVQTMTESFRPQEAVGGNISDISSVNSDIDSVGRSKIKTPNNRSMKFQNSNSPYKGSGIMALTNALRGGNDQGILKKSMFSQSKPNLLDKPIQEEPNLSEMGIKLENVDDDTPPRIRLKMDSDDEEIVLNPSDDEPSTPSLLVLGRYAKKKAHWNFIDKDEQIATRMARNGALKTDESIE